MNLTLKKDRTLMTYPSYGVYRLYENGEAPGNPWFVRQLGRNRYRLIKGMVPMTSYADINLPFKEMRAVVFAEYAMRET